MILDSSCLFHLRCLGSTHLYGTEEAKHENTDSARVSNRKSELLRVLINTKCVRQNTATKAWSDHIYIFAGALVSINTCLNIHFDNLTKKYGRVVALKNVTLDIAQGQIVAILGANAAGKTTLLRSLASVIVPDSGRILLDNLPLQRDNLGLRRRIMFLPDTPVLYAHLNPLQHIAMVLRLYQKDQPGIEDRAIEILKHLDLLPLIDTPVAVLSRGQIYKTALAALFLVDPELWLLDEPLASGIDPSGIIYLKQMCRQAASRGRTILYSTQILDVAENFSDRACVLHQGMVRFFDDVKSIQKGADSQGALEDLFRQLREEQ